MLPPIFLQALHSSPPPSPTQTQMPTTPQELALEAVAAFLQGRLPSSDHALNIVREASNAVALGHAVDLRMLYALVRVDPNLYF